LVRWWLFGGFLGALCGLGLRGLGFRRGGFGGDLCGGFCGEDFSAIGDEASLLGGGQGQEGSGLLGHLGEGEEVGGCELLLPFRGAEDAPVFDGDPVDAGEVRGRADAFGLEEVGVALRAGGVGDGAAGLISLGAAAAAQVDYGEHLAADGFVSCPEDEAAAPLDGLDDMGEGEEKGSNALDIHAGSISLRQVAPRLSLYGGVPPSSYTLGEI
jgi:hypothetical protein